MISCQGPEIEQTPEAVHLRVGGCIVMGRGLELHKQKENWQHYTAILEKCDITIIEEETPRGNTQGQTSNGFLQSGHSARVD